MTKTFSEIKQGLEAIEISILANASFADTVVTVLEQSDLQFNYQQLTDLAEDRLDALDLVLYDANFPKITLTKAIAFCSTGNKQIPVLVINGKPKISTAVRAIRAGAIDYLAANALSDLPQAIAKALAKSNSWYSSEKESQSDRQLKKLICENADGIMVVNDRGMVQFVNPAALELLGKSSSELIGEALGFPVVNGDYLEVDLPISKDKILVAQMRVSQIQWQGTKAYVVSLRDITQLKQAETERIELLAEAQAANRAKDEFLAVLSHELRTPLNPILGWSQLIVGGNLSEAQIIKGAEIIQRNAMLQTNLINDILDISRIIQGKLNLETRSVSLSDIINNALNTVSLAAQAKSIQIKANLEETCLVKGDPTRLQQVVWNLLSNAIKFTPNGGTVQIDLSSQKDHPTSYATIEITDSGKGISPEFLPHVFDYFCQAESSKSRSEGGLGLGLAIVRRLIELHGGEVTASSEGLGMGASFKIALPLLKRRQETITSSVSKRSNSLQDIKVLVVDDNDDSRNLICFALEAEGAKVNTARSATEALSQIEQFQPNILISDIGMPQVDGYELIQKIRQLPLEAGEKFKAIAISGYASDQDRQKSLTAGFDRHLNKPLDLDLLIEIIQ